MKHKAPRDTSSSSEDYDNFKKKALKHKASHISTSSSEDELPQQKYVLVKWLNTGKNEFTVLPAINVICNKNPLCGVTYEVKYEKNIYNAIVLKLGKLKLKYWY
jgi:hypothetical protein